MSFQIGLTPNRRAAARFIARVRRSLLQALAEEEARSGRTQSDLARALAVNRSVIHRQLRGKMDLSLGRVAELAWALEREPCFELRRMEVERGCSAPATASNLQSPIIKATIGRTSGSTTLGTSISSFGKVAA